MNIYYVSPIPSLLPHHEERLRKVGNLTLIQAERLSEEEMARIVQDADILVLARPAIVQCTDNFFSRVPKLKFLTTVSTSHDWIDVVSAKKHGIVVSNCKGANARSVAEATWALILSLAKRTYEYMNDVKNSGAFRFRDYVGMELQGKTLGIIGLGDIGSEVAKIGSAFGMNVIGHNRSKKYLMSVRQVEMEELLRESDIISVHVPLTDTTKHLLASKEIELMKQAVILVNTSDEAVVDKDAVLAALRAGKVFGYGVETKLMTPIPSDDPYFSLKNVIAYPHNGFNSKEANIHVKDTWVNNVVQFVTGAPQNVV